MMQICYTNIKPIDFLIADKIISDFHKCDGIHYRETPTEISYIRTRLRKHTTSNLYFGTMRRIESNFENDEYTFIDFYEWIKETYGDNYQYVFEGNNLGLL